MFYRKHNDVVQISQVLTALAEGVGIRAVGRIFAVTPETVLAWLIEASGYLEAFHTHMAHDLVIEQVQLDEIYGVLRAHQAGEISDAEAIDKLDKKRNSIWLWTAIDPISKFWLSAVVGERDRHSAWQIVHKVVAVLAAGIVPLFVTDGNRAYEQPILSHFGYWQAPQGHQRKPRWMPLPHTGDGDRLH